MQTAWRMWCEDNGHFPGSVADFGKKLRAVVPRIDDVQRRENGQRERLYVGITLNPDTRTSVNIRQMGV